MLIRRNDSFLTYLTVFIFVLKNVTPTLYVHLSSLPFLMFYVTLKNLYTRH
jgi:hypothetical protein